MSKIKFEVKDDVVPLCPHCKRELETVWIIEKGMGFIEQKQVAVCPHCRSFLGFAIWTAS